METRDTILAAIGNTPLIKLRRASEETGCTILGKAEFMNPGHSVKDRAGLGIITDAIDSYSPAESSSRGPRATPESA